MLAYNFFSLYKIYGQLFQCFFIVNDVIDLLKVSTEIPSERSLICGFIAIYICHFCFYFAIMNGFLV